MIEQMHQQVSLLGTEVRTLESTATGKTYKISVALPVAYNNDEPVKIQPFDDIPAAWPVVYVLDPHWFFGLATDLVRYMYCWHRTLDAFVVGVGYPDQRSVQATWQHSLACRTHDLTPVQSGASERGTSEWLKVGVKTGGAPAFLQFLRDELIPLIDREYPTDPRHRVLFGHSHGGGFALFAMLQQPELFRSYIASSPSLAFADATLFKLESEYAAQHRALAAQLFLSAGELEQDVADEDETLTDMYHFAAILESRKYEGLSLVKNVFRDCNHCEVVAPAMHAGLHKALRK